VHWWIDIRDKPGLLWAFLHHFGTDSHVSLEGDVRRVSLSDIPGATGTETPALRRQTLHPPLGFVVIPINADNVRILHERLSATGLFQDGGALIHVQMEHAGQLVLGAYDNFHQDCVVAYEPTPEALLGQLAASGVIRSYRLGPDR
jgi:hypothetical protein